ncbi:MAG: porin [Thiotrichaceae bacterium]
MKTVLASAILITFGSSVYADTILYGQFHGSLDIIKSANSSKDTTLSSNSSRIGIKGSTDLNDDLRAIFQAEWEMDTGGGDNTQFIPQNASTQTSANNILTDRNQIVGLSGRLGTVFMGRFDTPLKIIGRKADLFWRSQLGQNRNITRRDINWDARHNNIIGYQLPYVEGLKVLGTYVIDRDDDSNGNSNENNSLSINGIYENNKLTIGAGYEVRTRDTSEDEEAFRLMGTYEFGDTKLVGFYQDEDNGQLGEASVYGMGGSHKISASGLIKAQYYTRDQTGEDGELLAIGYDHSLGKKTQIYAQYARTENLGGIGGAGHDERFTAGGNAKVDGISIGIRHKF